jgi:hypothetical protein
VAAPIAIPGTSIIEEVFDWCNRLERCTFSSVRAIDGSHELVPKTTMGVPWFFLPEITCKLANPGSVCDDL